MGDANVYFHLKPIAELPHVDKLWIVRPLPPIVRGTIDKTEYREIRGPMVGVRLWRMYKEAVRIGKRPEVRLFVSFFAFPYGLVALVAGWRTGKPVHLGFVGSDWYRYCASWFGPLLDLLFRHASFFTVTGYRMKQEMVARGYPADRIHYLPHAIDLDEYRWTPPAQRKYDALFVGHLIPLKRVDLILDAVAEARARLPSLRVAIVGDGPLRATLEATTRQLGLQETVEFLGRLANPAPVFSDTRTVIIASDTEGYPFVLVEGQAACAVPISTDVGTISDYVSNGVTGLLVPKGDAAALAQALSSLLTDHALYQRIHDNLKAERAHLGFHSVTARWGQWIASASPNPGPTPLQQAE
jgi:glycosyltransferase involved in cell wall biosynthesis